MTYYGVILLMAGYQADETHILKQYHAMIDRYVHPSAYASVLFLTRASLVWNLGFLLAHYGFSIGYDLEI